MKKASGLRNRFRSGKSSYARKGKGRQSDKYGTYNSGKQTAHDIINGRVLALHHDYLETR